MEKLKVFIVEDDIVILSGLEANFASLGMNVFSSNGNDELSNIFKDIISEKVDLIILDLVLPNIDGFKLLKVLKEEVPTVPIFVFSNFSEKDVEIRCKNLGADYYYLKQDFKTDEFASKVDKIFKNRERIKR